MFNRKRYLKMSIVLILVILFTSCAINSKEEVSENVSKSSGKIYLYGEQHGEKSILDKEFEIWYEYYNNKNMRHLFVELPYYTTEYLNIWMKSDNDLILEKIYNELENTAIHKPAVKEFYKKIKEKCPETVFHGTDIGHQYYSTGKDYIEYLKSNDLESSEKYEMTLKAINQGKKYYKESDPVYRENMMVKNFIFEFNKLKDKDVMGIYGNGHVVLGKSEISNKVYSMAYQLNEYYNGNIFLENLDIVNNNIEPIRKEVINIDGKDYNVFYFGKQSLDGFKDFAYREYWRVENAYNDFKENNKTGDILPINNYIMKVSEGEVYIIDYTKKDGSVERKYYLAEGNEWNGLKTTEEFILNKNIN